MVTPQLSDGLDDLDSERPDAPFVVQVDGRVVRFRGVDGPGWKELLTALRSWPIFMTMFGPTKRAHIALVEHLPVWKMRALVRAWRVHHGLCVSEADHMRLVGMLGKPAYRAAIERDLQEVHGLDLAAEWQSRRWRRLLSFIDGLDRTSHLQEVMTQDDELAEAVLEREDKADGSKPPRRRMREFSAEAELLSVAVDRLGELIQVQGVKKGSRRRRVEPMPRPETAMHRARLRKSKRKHAYTVSRVYGYVDAQGKPTGKQPEGGSPPTF